MGVTCQIRQENSAPAHYESQAHSADLLANGPTFVSLIFNVNSSPLSKDHHQRDAADATMASLPNFPNIYTHRKVAETAAKACEICYKLSASVLVTPDKQVVPPFKSLILTRPAPLQSEPGFSYQTDILSRISSTYVLVI